MPEASSTPRRRRGRPPLDATSPSVRVDLRFSQHQYEFTAARAHASRVSVAAWVRTLLKIAHQRAATTPRQPSQRS